MKNVSTGVLSLLLPEQTNGHKACGWQTADTVHDIFCMHHEKVSPNRPLLNRNRKTGIFSGCMQPEFATRLMLLPVQFCSSNSRVAD